MDELDHGLQISLKGSEAAEAVAMAHAQMKRWKLLMPDIEPLVLDFGLGDFSEIGEIEFWIANEVEAGYCGKYLFLFEAQTCPAHYHKGKLETFFLVKGRLDVLYGVKEIVLEQGATLLVETNVMHQFTALEPSLLLEVSAPSIIDDNYFKDTRIPIGGNYSGNR